MEKCTAFLLRSLVIAEFYQLLWIQRHDTDIKFEFYEFDVKSEKLFHGRKFYANPHQLANGLLK
jgi:hypothetical protein